MTAARIREWAVRMRELRCWAPACLCDAVEGGIAGMTEAEAAGAVLALAEFCADQEARALGGAPRPQADRDPAGPFFRWIEAHK